VEKLFAAKTGDAVWGPVGLGESMLLNLDVDGQIVKVRLPEVQRFSEGETLRLSFDPGHVHVFDPQSRKRIAAPASTERSPQ
jgi:ABC-type sugar transport system ATPase subunit